MHMARPGIDLIVIQMRVPSFRNETHQFHCRAQSFRSAVAHIYLTLLNLSFSGFPSSISGGSIGFCIWGANGAGIFVWEG